MASTRRFALVLQLATLELKLYNFVRALERHYAPDQPRVPAGNPDGGQWTDGGGGGRLPLGVSRPGGASQEDHRKPVRTALAAKLVGKRFGFGDDKVVVHCYYRDVLGRDFTIERDATLVCPPTWPAARTE